MTSDVVFREGALPVADDRAFLGHPKALGYIAFTEAWERFSFYGTHSLLGLYLVHDLLVGNADGVAFFGTFRSFFGGLEGQALASAILGAYFAGAYCAPLVGGLIADLLLGKRRTVLIGAVMMTFGHFLMAFELTFLFALLLLVVGSGLLKGNLASQVGTLYARNDRRRVYGFHIYYLGLTGAVILAPLTLGTLGEKVDWHAGFAAAGFGMLISLAAYVAGQKYFPNEDCPGGRVAWPHLRRDDWRNLFWTLALLPILSVALVPNSQIFATYLLWGDKVFDLVFLGQRVPTTWLVTVDSVLSFASLAAVPLFYRWWERRSGWEPDELTKLVIGSGFAVLGTLCLVAAAGMTSPGEKIGIVWPLMFHMLNCIGFSHILPVSIALFTKNAPPAINSTVIGIYYLALFPTGMIIGWLGSRFDQMPTTTFWLIHAGCALAAGAAFLLLKIFASHRFGSADTGPARA